MSKFLVVRAGPHTGIRCLNIKFPPPTFLQWTWNTVYTATIQNTGKFYFEKNTCCLNALISALMPQCKRVGWIGESWWILLKYHEGCGWNNIFIANMHENLAENGRNLWEKNTFVGFFSSLIFVVCDALHDNFQSYGL